MRSFSIDLTAELERLHAGFRTMAASFRDFAATGGKYLGPRECEDMAAYFEGKAVYIAETLAHQANEPTPAPAPVIRIAAIDGKEVS